MLFGTGGECKAHLPYDSALLLSGRRRREQLRSCGLSLHARLRTETAPAHERLERSLDLLSRPLDRDRLTALLVRFHGFHQDWEPALACCLPAELVPRPRLPLLEHDLRTLGVGNDIMTAIPSCAHAASLGEHQDTALGSVYVLEGSTLGGRVVARHFAEAPWWPAAGLGYFDPYGDETATRWRHTLAQLAAAGGDADRIVAGAVRTFEILQLWLVPPRVTAAA